MSGKISRRPMIGILTGSLVSGNRCEPESPRTHMDSQNKSPRGMKSFDFGGVGLSIVAALENSGDGSRDVPASKALFIRNFNGSNPIPVYRGGVVDGGRKGDDRTPFRIPNSVKRNRASVFHISPVKSGEVAGVPAPDFLSSCNLCQKKLHGKDIFMYRGEKAFCSTECRHRQITLDERQEKCISGAPPCANGQFLGTGILAV